MTAILFRPQYVNRSLPSLVSHGAFLRKRVDRCSSSVYSGMLCLLTHVPGRPTDDTAVSIATWLTEDMIIEWSLAITMTSWVKSQITSLTIVYSIVYSDADQKTHQSSASLAFVWSPVNSPHKWPVTQKCFHLMTSSWQAWTNVICSLLWISVTIWKSMEAFCRAVYGDGVLRGANDEKPNTITHIPWNS